MSGSQHGYAESFDNFGPIGPVIASPKGVTDPENLSPKTWVNEEIKKKKKNSRTDDLIFSSVARIVRHMSQGMTLTKGTVIMTDTPDGVAAFLQPPNWLKGGDVVQIEIERIGNIENKIAVSPE